MTAIAAPDPSTPARRRNPWPWFAAIVLALVVTGDMALVVATKHIRPTLVEDHPWLDSAGVDGVKVAHARFVATGLGLHLDDQGHGGLRCILLPESPGIGAARVHLYRPDGAAPDQTVAWPDTAHPLTLHVGRDGYWRVYLLDGAGNRIADADIALASGANGRAPPVDTP